MAQRKDFHAFCQDLAAQVGVGRRGLRRDWSALEKLVRDHVLPRMPEAEVKKLLGKGIAKLEAEENDLKAIAAYGAAQGWVDAASLCRALEEADRSNPLWFLARVSGKTFGAAVAPRLAEYWLCEEGDRWTRRKDVEFYDYDWYVAAIGSTIRLELKASSERNPRFQQIRDPRMSRNPEAYDYDGCLCVGGHGGALEWWYFPAKAVEDLIHREVFPPQHGGRKMVSGTFWVTVSKKNREILEEFRVPSEWLRNFILKNYA